MFSQRLLVCDIDPAYGKALSVYLMRTLPEYSVTLYSNMQAFLMDEETYDLALLGREFIEEVDKMSKSDLKRFGRIMLLSSHMNDDFGIFPSVFKFQDMSSFLQTIFPENGNKNAHNALTERQSRWIGIYSPIRHELQLPFALAYGRILAGEHKVLFVDMEINSIFRSLIDCEADHNLLDVLYLLAEENVDIKDCAFHYEGIDIILPMQNFGEASSVSREEWERFFAAADAADYDRIVVLFDDGIQCVERLLDICVEMVLLNRPGDYYRKSEKKIRSYIDTLATKPEVREVKLAMSGSNLSDGTYRFEQLLQGNLGRFVAETFTP